MKQKEVYRRRAKLATQLPNPEEVVRGSLLKREIHHRQGCSKCAGGGGHPVWVLTVSYPGGRTKQISLKAAQKPQVVRWLSNYKKLKAKLEAISELNRQLLRPEK